MRLRHKRKREGEFRKNCSELSLFILCHSLAWRSTSGALVLLLGGLRGDRDLELGGLAGDARVDLRESLSLGFDVVDLAVEVDDVGLGAAGGDADALAGDLRGEDDVVEESLVDGGNSDTAGKGARDELFT